MHKRTITETDIVNFANVSWDHFYAHTDATSLDGNLYEEWHMDILYCHGWVYLLMLLKGPVLLNYGLEECRFTKPVYAGMTIGVKLTVKEKYSKKREEEDYTKGIVKWYVEVYDETDETVAIALQF